jgi:hypothetical protein
MTTLHAKQKNPEFSTGGATVSIASKLPMDLTLRVFDFKTQHEPVMGGGVREYKIAEQRRGSQSFIAIGNSFAQNKGPHQQISSGYAITHDIPKDFWDEWLEQNKEADYVINGMIFAHVSSSSTIAEAREKEAEKSGLERLDPNRLPKGLETSDHFRAAS